MRRQQLYYIVKVQVDLVGILMVAGKGRSGTIAVSYLVTHAAWDSGKALKHFTTQRMRYGEGVSIPSQRRWVRYVELWARKSNNQYTSGQVEIIKIQFWGMKVDDGGDKIEVGIAGFVDGEHPGAKAVNKIHVFEDEEVYPLKASLIFRGKWKVV
jgi:protein-tyrosine phosphatase